MGQDLFSEQNSKNRSDDDSVRIAEFAEQAYLDYAISVVKGRALPQGADGQKPVQRRILYAMNQLGLSVEAKPVKSARVVGEVLGRYHPHGDSAAYDALVRMAQSFSLRYPLIDGQGNFGSRDGDGAAAMRYTEARLTSYAKLLLDEVDMGTVDFIDNYDGSTREPAMLPARLPMVLLNGASGIAVGMATEIPSHNLKEVAAAAALLIRKPKSTIEDLLSVLPGPDLDAVRDESGRDAPVRLVIEPRSSRIELNELVNLLLVNTSLETNLSLNMVMVGLDGRPVQKSLLDCLSEWCTYRLETVRRRSAYRLDKVLDRIHVLEGRQLVLLNIDQVIRIIRESDDPKAALIEAFKLSERQADDILEIRLRQLAKLEAIRIEQELRSLRDESRQLESLIKDEQQLRKQVVKEIEADARQYGDARRTLLESSDKASVALRIADEPVTVIVSEKGWVRVRQGHGHEPGQFSFKAGDGLDALYPVMTTDQLFVISTSGRVYALAVNQLPSARGDGSPITTLIELEAGSRVAFVFAAQVGDRVIFASRLGQGFQCLAADLMTRQRAGKQFMHLDANDMLIRPVVDIKSAEQRLLCLSEQGRALCFSLEELRQLKQGGRGVSLMDCDADDPLVAIAAHTPSSVVIEGTARGSKAIRREFSVRELTAYDANRGRKGKLLEPRIKGGLIVSIGSTSTGQVKDSAR
ncbi:MAG: DNA topoisomerase IV subunit A [Betaproteobacteria bacterium]|nr:DNA topoisomerase IV subunit A [Betaproteobacteria bacterium]